ncbi:MAG: hypothetical protein ACU0GG_16245 [Paracoccaceae bacterium]
MTAEIAILNRSAIALAADSAVTVGASSRNTDRRVWKTTNKIFSLSPENDIAVMIYGTADHGGMPWETIIKQFSQSNTTRFDTVESCMDAFCSFVGGFPAYDDDFKLLNSQVLVVTLIELLFSEQNNFKKKSDKKQSVVDKISFFEKELIQKSIDVLPVTLSDFDVAYGDLVDDVIDNNSEFSVSAHLRKELHKFAWDAVRKSIASGHQTGLVFAGFGRNETLPCVSSVYCDGQTDFGLRKWPSGNSVDMDRWKQSTAFILPFAQDDIAHLFIEGIEEEYIGFLDTTISEALSKRSEDVIKKYVSSADRTVERAIQKKENTAAVKSLISDFKELRRIKIVDPMMSVIRSLPKEELAAMAEALVEITSLRRKMDSAIETVAGPVDVAIISKGDGLVWIKRKHYFDPENNTEFFHRRKLRRDQNG